MAMQRYGHATASFFGKIYAVGGRDADEYLEEVERYDIRSGKWVQYYNILYYTILYFTILYYTILYYTILY